MRNEPVSSIMTAPVTTVEADGRLSDVRRLMREHGFHHVPVVRGRRLIGILSMTDLLELSFAEFAVDDQQRDAVLDERCTIAELMSTDTVTLDAGATVRDAAELLAGGLFHSVPVIDDSGDLLGIVTSTDLLRCLLQD